MKKFKSIASSLLAVAAFVTIASATASAAACGSYTPVGPLCQRTVLLGWGTAGQGTQSVIEFISRPAAP
jgi:hypothetical protein